MLDLNAMDFSHFIDVPAPVKYYEYPKLTMTSQGVLTMSNALQAAAKDGRTFTLRISEDGRYLLLKLDSKGNIKFSDKGTVTHKIMKDMLTERKIQLPACYLLDWCEGQNAWVGCSGDLPAPPSAQEMLPPQKRKGRKSA